MRALSGALGGTGLSTKVSDRGLLPMSYARLNSEHMCTGVRILLSLIPPPAALCCRLCVRTLGLAPAPSDMVINRRNLSLKVGGWKGGREGEIVSL